jgi:hypothetical protein
MRGRNAFGLPSVFILKIRNEQDKEKRTPTGTERQRTMH